MMNTDKIPVREVLTALLEGKDLRLGSAY